MSPNQMTLILELETEENQVTRIRKSADEAYEITGEMTRPKAAIEH